MHRSKTQRIVQFESVNIMCITLRYKCCEASYENVQCESLVMLLSFDSFTFHTVAISIAGRDTSHV